jgi:hypothetical protein
MNKNLHRLIFNHARGLRMAVQETASSCGKARGATRSAGSAGSVGSAAPASPPKLKALLGALLLGMAGSLSPVLTVHAQIMADPGAPGSQRPTVLTAPNGVPLVNIQTPSAAGSAARMKWPPIPSTRSMRASLAEVPERACVDSTRSLVSALRTAICVESTLGPGSQRSRVPAAVGVE